MLLQLPSSNSKLLIWYIRLTGAFPAPCTIAAKLHKLMRQLRITLIFTNFTLFSCRCDVILVLVTCQIIKYSPLDPNLYETWTKEISKLHFENLNLPGEFTSRESSLKDENGPTRLLSISPIRISFSGSHSNVAAETRLSPIFSNQNVLYGGNKLDVIMQFYCVQF